MTKRKGNGERGGRGGGPGHGGRGRGGGGGRGRSREIQASHLMDEALDFNIQIYADAHPATPPHRRSRGGHTRHVLERNSESSTPNRRRGRGFRGRGRGHPEMNYRSRHSDFGIGASPKEHGRDRGIQKLRPDAPLTRLLYQDRPLLRPIVFVRSTLNPTLFNQDEALLKPGVEEVGDTEQSHVPTAARVSRVFSGGNIHVIESSSSETDSDDTNDDDEELEVVDFNDVAKLFEPTKNPKKISPKESSREVVDKQFIGGFTDNNSIPASVSSPHRPQHDIDTLTKMMDENLSATEGSLKDGEATHSGLVEPSLYYIDTQPTKIPAEIALTSNSFPSDEFDDEVIVYVAPHPRKGVQTSPEKQSSTNVVPDTSEFTPYVRDASLSLAVASSSTIKQQPIQPQPQTPSLSSFSFSFPTPEGKIRGRLRIPPVTIPRLAISWKRKKDILNRKSGKPKSSFRTFGAMREEAQLHDPKQNERRRGDSDLDWGDTDSDGGGGDEQNRAVDRVGGVESPSGLVNGTENGKVNGKDKGKGKAREAEDGHGMEVDTDMDLNAMQQFVGGLLGEDARRHMTMDDLMDEEQMMLENEQDTGEDSMGSNESGSEGESDDEDAEVERILANEEAMLISETLEFDDEDEDEEEDDGSEDDEDEDQTPRTSFQKRLERLRKKASSSRPDDEYDISDDYEAYDDMLERNMLFAEMDNKTRLFFDDLAESDREFESFNHTKSKKRRQADLPEDLKIQWEKDRLKKAAYKKARVQARLEEAADPLSRRKGGKKGRKAMLAAARVDPTIIVLPNRVIDMVTLVQQIKRFINDEDGPLTMSLPPTNKATRKNIHDMAAAFYLKSVSKGYGDARYTTLIKTSKTSFYVDEAKVAKIVRRSGGMGARGDSFVQDRKRTKGKKARGSDGQILLPRHREGDEVGKAAPKINSSNLGFRMLAMMGWSEGERIGVTGGLQDPLTAIIKNTKLGLGAAK